MSQSLSVLEFLDDLRPNGQCDDCLSIELEIQPRQTVNQICRALAAARKLRREKLACCRCGKVKLINIYQASGALAGEVEDSEHITPLVRSQAESPGTDIDVEKARTEIVRMCRILWDRSCVEQPPRSVAAVIVKLRNDDQLPNHIANMMMTVCNLRNVYVYEGMCLGARETLVAVNAKAIIDDWWASLSQHL